MFITFLASFLIWVLFFGLFVLWVIDGKIKKEQVLHALFAMLATWLLAVVIKELFPTSRPYVVELADPLTITDPHDASFPSMHTAIAFALSTTIFLHDRKIGLIFILWSIFVALGRVLANVHYPIDTFGGATLGILVAFIVEKTHFSSLFKRN